ncbi:MAG: glycosyltransferase family 2 protein [Nitrososphaerales archaeon]
MKLSVVLPVHSEEESVTCIVERLQELLKEKIQEIILVVSPKSQENSISICKELAQKYDVVKFLFQKENPGLGRAVRQGLSYATGTHILWMDSDGETSPETVPLLIKKMEETDCDMVVASRWIKGGAAIRYDKSKYFLNRIFQIFFRLLFSTKIHDLTLGFKLMKRKIIDNIDFYSDFHDIAVETTLKPIKYGYKVEEVPTVWKSRQEGISKNKMSANFKYIFRALKIFFNRSK